MVQECLQKALGLLKNITEFVEHLQERANNFTWAINRSLLKLQYMSISCPGGLKEGLEKKLYFL